VKIVAWNCNMAFRKKINIVQNFQPDIMVISECEEFSKFDDNLLGNYPNRHWIGDNKSKGIGILAKSTYELQLHEYYNDKFRYVIPIKVKGEYEFILFGIWAMNDKQNKRNRYIAQVGAAIEYYSELLLQDSIFIGDFNSNVIWDNESPKRNFTHSDVVNRFNAHKIKSVFHELNNQKHGEELVATYHMYRHLDKPYHIDYAFCSNNLFKKLINFSIGKFDDWIGHSDHMPLIVEFD